MEHNGLALGFWKWSRCPQRHLEVVPRAWPGDSLARSSAVAHRDLMSQGADGAAHLQPEDETFADWRLTKARRTMRLATLFAEVTELWDDSRPRSEPFRVRGAS